MHGASPRCISAGDESTHRTSAPTIGDIIQHPSTSAYWLSKHVHLCMSGNQIVLLDLKNDRYMAIDAAHARPLAGLVRGWPAANAEPVESSASIDSTDTARVVARVMMDRGLLTRDYALGKDAAPVAMAPPFTTLVLPPSLLPGENELPLPMNSRHVSTFLTAAVVTVAKLRWRSLEGIVRDVMHRRLSRMKSSHSCSMEVAKGLVAIFRRLRPFAFTAQNACLFDSLALLNFLSRYRLFPHWVFGVRTAPFAAHCWVQEGNTVFNDSVEHVSFYTPIMVV